jgi:hypothetical protein
MTDRQDFLDIAFNTDTEEATPPFVVLPSGKYTAEIVSVSCGNTKNGKGYMVTLNWSITEGEHTNRTIFQTILLQHESEEAQKYGRMKFQDVCLATGMKGEISDLTVLKHIPCSIFVKIRKDESGQYADRNEVGRVMPLPVSQKDVGAAFKEAKDALKEAQKTQPSFKAVNAPFSDDIPF